MTAGVPGGADGSRSAEEVIGSRIAKTDSDTGGATATDRILAGNAEILATTYVPERLPSQYLRRWRA
jgi:hypothetical protein